MSRRDFDLFVIGGGSGGVRGARVAADHGARVAIAEADRFGGTCVIRGCVPKKLFVYAAHYAEDIADAAAYGWTIEGARFDWATLVRNKDAEIARLSGVYESVLERRGVTRFAGRARLVDRHAIDVAGRRVSADTILIATGGRPARPAVQGSEHALVSDDMFRLPALPASMAVVGGGYIAVEFAGILRNLGVDVTLVYRGDKILRGFDEDVRDAAQENLRQHGVDVRLGAVVERIEKTPEGIELVLTDGERLPAGGLLSATGRAPNTAGLGLEDVGVALGASGAMTVDAYSRTSVDNIFAVGDVTDRINLTPVALHEAHAFADTRYGGLDRPVDHAHVPSAVFAQPPIATVGLTEAAARAAHPRVDVFRARFKPLKHTLTGRAQTSMMKLVVDADTDRVLGAHMVGDDAPEIIQCLAIAVKMGATKADFDRTLGIHPTAAEEFVTMRKPLK